MFDIAIHAISGRYGWDYNCIFSESFRITGMSILGSDWLHLVGSGGEQDAFIAIKSTWIVFLLMETTTAQDFLMPVVLKADTTLETAMGPALSSLPLPNKVIALLGPIIPTHKIRIPSMSHWRRPLSFEAFLCVRLQIRCHDWF